ncbi:unnamed protein product [Coccothraustes coccothraustes]
MRGRKLTINLFKSIKENKIILVHLCMTHKKSCFGGQFSQAVKVVTKVCLTVWCSLEKLQKTWTESDFKGTIIQKCDGLRNINFVYSNKSAWHARKEKAANFPALGGVLDSTSSTSQLYSGTLLLPPQLSKAPRFGKPQAAQQVIMFLCSDFCMSSSYI